MCLCSCLHVLHEAWGHVLSLHTAAAYFNKAQAGHINSAMAISGSNVHDISDCTAESKVAILSSTVHVPSASEQQQQQ